MGNQHLCFNYTVLIVCLSVSAFTAAAGMESVVVDEKAFYEGLADSSVSLIRLEASIVLARNLWQQRPTVAVDRNLTIQGIGDYRVIDFNYIEGRVHVQPGCSITFQHLEVQDVMLRLSMSLQFFAASPGAVVHLLDVRRHQTVCLPLDLRRSIMLSADRPSLFPGAQSFHISREPVCILRQHQRDCFFQVGVYEDIVVTTPLIPENQDGGYIVQYTASVLLCDSFAPRTCLQQQGMQDCISNLQQQAFLNEFNPSGTKNKEKVAIIASLTGVSVLVLLAGGLATFACYRKRKKVSANETQDEEKADVKEETPVVDVAPARTSSTSTNQKPMPSPSLASHLPDPLGSEVMVECIKGRGMALLLRSRSLRTTV